MRPSFFETHSPSLRKPVLLFDKDSWYTSEFCSVLASDFLPIVLTSHRDPVLAKSVVVIPVRKGIPKIPDNSFAAILVVASSKKVGRLEKALFKEAVRKGVPFVVVLPQAYTGSYQWKHFLSYTHTYLFFVGDMLTGEDDSPPGAIIQEAIEKHRIIVAGDGLTPLYPVSKKIVVETVVQKVLVAEERKQLHSIVPDWDMTELSFARLLTRVDPTLVMDFVKRKRTRHAPVLPESVSRHTLSQDVLQHEIVELLSGGLPRKRLQSVVQPREFSIIRPVASIIGVLILVVGVLLLTTVGLWLFGVFSLRVAVNEAMAFDLTKAKRSASFASGSFAMGDVIARSLLSPLHETPAADALSPFANHLAGGKEVADSLETVIIAGSVYADLLSGAAVSKDDFISATSRMQSGLLQFRQSMESGLVPEQYQEAVASVDPLIDLFLASVDVLPTLFGFDGERVYLVLLQNNNELRPGGGFIGSFGLLKMEQGKVVDFQLHDVYDADGQLQGHIDPPTALAEHLGLSHWYLRDSNFSIDFPTNAASASYFLNLELGEQADGVVAVDASFLEGVLQATGPLYVPEMRREIAASEVTTLLQREIEDEFFPGSQTKRHILSGVYRALLLKLSERSSDQVGRLSQVLAAALAQKHIMLSFADPSVTQPFLLQGFSSSLTEPREEDEVSDFVGISEANVGLNKVNAFVRRSIDYDVVMREDGSFLTTVTLSLENTSTTEDRFGGAYTTYTRFILPSGASPQSIVIDGAEQVVLTPLRNEQAEQNRGAVAGNVLEVDRVDEFATTNYGFLIDVPHGATKEVVVAYFVPGETVQDAFAYSLLLFKQPGTGPDPFTFSLTLPEGYSLISSTPQLEMRATHYSLLSRLTTDRTITARIGRR